MTDSGTAFREYYDYEIAAPGRAKISMADDGARLPLRIAPRRSNLIAL